MTIQRPPCTKMIWASLRDHLALNVVWLKGGPGYPWWYSDPAGGTVTAGAGDDSAARARHRGRMRASDADREQVIDTLKAAYAYGLVTKEEFDDRVSQSLTSRTIAELALVTADIPAGLPAAPSTLSPPPAKAHPPARATLKPGERAVVAAAVLSVLAFIAAYSVGNPATVLAGLLGLVSVGSGLTGIFLAAVQMLRSRHRKHSGSQRPPHRAINTGHSTGQLPRTSQPRRQGPASAARSRPRHPRLST
jgi:hypothetical protein